MDFLSDSFDFGLETVTGVTKEEHYARNDAQDEGAPNYESNTRGVRS